MLPTCLREKKKKRSIWSLFSQVLWGFSLKIFILKVFLSGSLTFEIMISSQMISKRDLYKKLMRISNYAYWHFESLWMVSKPLVTSINELTIMCKYEVKATMRWKGLYGELKWDNV